MSLSSQVRVAVLRGGVGSSDLYHSSLGTGKYILGHLPEMYHGVDVLIDTKGIWHINGAPRSPERILHNTDIVWNALHVNDPVVDQTLRLFGVRHVGSVNKINNITNKNFVKSVMQKSGVHIPETHILRKEELTQEKIQERFRAFVYPARVGAVGSMGSVGSATVSYIVAHLPELHQALAEIFGHSATAIVEEHITGRHILSGIIKGYRGQEYYTLPAMEKREDIRKDMLDHRSLLDVEKKEISRIASVAHRVLHDQHKAQYSQTEVVIHPRRGIFLVDTNTSPDLHDSTPFVHGLGLVGAPFGDFIGHVLGKASVNIYK